MIIVFRNLCTASLEIPESIENGRQFKAVERCWKLCAKKKISPIYAPRPVTDEFVKSAAVAYGARLYVSSTSGRRREERERRWILAGVDRVFCRRDI